MASTATLNHQHCQKTPQEKSTSDFRNYEFVVPHTELAFLKPTELTVKRHHLSGYRLHQSSHPLESRSAIRFKSFEG